MTKDTYEKANRLIQDIDTIDRQLEQVEKYNDWIKLSTECVKATGLSCQFQKDLVSWLKRIREQYQKEFDELV